MADPKPFGDSNEFDDDDMAAVGRALIETLNANAGHSVLKGWAPAQCPSEIVADLLNSIDDVKSAAADEIARLRSALAGLVEHNTQIARNSYSLCRGGEWVLTDEIWRESAPEEFTLIEAARKALGPQMAGGDDGS